MNLVRDTKQILLNGGSKETIYLSVCPDGEDIPDNILILYEYAGQPLDGMDTAFSRLSLQVMVRDSEFDTGLSRAQKISAALREIGNTDKENPPVTVGDTIYYQFTALQSPFKLKEDDAGRIYFAQNFRVFAREI